MRMNSVTSTIENGFVHIPAQADWLPEYLHELSLFPNGKYDDQVDSTSQALDWSNENAGSQELGVIGYLRAEAARMGITDPFYSSQNELAAQRMMFNRSRILRDRQWR